MKSPWLTALFRTRPMHWGSAEMLIMRLLFAAVLLWAGIFWELPEAAAQVPKPEWLAMMDHGGAETMAGPESKSSANGLAAVVPLGWMVDTARSLVIQVLTGLTLILYVAGMAPVLTLLPALILMTGTGALRNSMGDISHHTQLVAMVLLAQWIVYLTAAIRQRRERPLWLRPAHQVQEQAVFWSLLTIGAGYFASGITKLEATDFAWIQRVPSMALQVMKAVWSASYSKGEPVSGFKAVTVPGWILTYPNAARLFFGTGLLLELLGPMLVMGRRRAFWTGLAIIVMHIGISVVMDIEFRNHIFLLAIFAVNIPGLILRSRRKAAATTEADGGKEQPLKTAPQSSA
ncbi:MAG: hypothetical protein JWM59_3317 [Verrucomicrobiales bacterium]|nr:hypothetical protein [Verrucomicrobiales bacterium]